MVFKDGWVVVNEVPTHVLSWGGWIDDDNVKVETAIFCIPGNPGLTHFYITFLSHLYELVKIPIWVINHSGHEIPPAHTNLIMPSMNRSFHLYSLAGQVAHNREFLEKYVLPKVNKVVLFGHSVGGKMSVELLKVPRISNSVVQVHLAFPTLQHIDQSRQGSYLLKKGRVVRFFALLFISVFNVFPLKIRRWMLNKLMSYSEFLSKFDDNCREGALCVLTRKVMSAFMKVGYDYLISIRELDVNVLNEHGSKVHAYFIPWDRWVPLWQYEDFRARCPSANTYMLGAPFIHAFVLMAPKEMAELIAPSIKNVM